MKMIVAYVRHEAFEPIRTELSSGAWLSKRSDSDEG
jgi:hypothetical protein